MRWIANEHVVPIAVHLPHHLITGRAAHRDFYGCPVNFGEARTCSIVDKADLERRILSSDEELASLLDGTANRYLEQRMAGRFAVRVRDLMMAQLPHDVPSKKRTAHMLGMTERTLLRRLKEEGTRSEEHTSELQSLMRISYAVFCLKKKNQQHT